MIAEPTVLSGVLILRPKLFSDSRGYFFESYNQRVFAGLGIAGPFVQDNHSRSIKNALRGLHYQVEKAQGKLVRVVDGEIFDVVVDVRHASPTFGRWIGNVLSAENKIMVWAPPGYAHGFLVLSESAEVLYKTTDFYAPEHERCIIWNDPDIGIRWPLAAPPILSDKDKIGKRLSEAEVFA